MCASCPSWSFCIGAVTKAAHCILNKKAVKHIGKWESHRYKLLICLSSFSFLVLLGLEVICYFRALFFIADFQKMSCVNNEALLHVLVLSEQMLGQTASSFFAESSNH